MAENTSYEGTRSAQEHVTPPVTGSDHINVGQNERLISMAGGLLLAYLGLRNIRSFSTPNILSLVAGGLLLYRGATGHCPVNSAIGRNSAKGHGRVTGVDLGVSVTVDRPRDEVYRFWRKLENLPRFMRHLKEVKQLDNNRSKWTARVPGDITSVSWEAEIVDEIENQKIAWRSVPGTMIDNAGEVFFLDAPGKRGTEIRTRITYRPPAGEVGEFVAQMLTPVFEKMVREDILRLKDVLTQSEEVSGRQG